MLQSVALVLAALLGAPSAAPAPWTIETTVALDPDRKNGDVTVRVVVPSSCHEAAGTVAAAPDGVRVRDDLPVVTVNFRTTPGRLCPDLSTVVEQRHERLHFGRMNGIAIFVVSDGVLVARTGMSIW